MMKIVGRSYLTVTLKPVLNEVGHNIITITFFLFLLMLTGHVYSCIKYIKWFIVFILLLQIFESNKTCEIDPVKLKEGDNVEVNKVR